MCIKKRIGMVLLMQLSYSVLLSMPGYCGGQAEDAPAPKPNFELDANQASELATKIDELVTSRFLDKQLVDRVWKPAFAARRQSLMAERNLLGFSAEINGLLRLLHTSHTQFLTENDETFYFLRSLFAAFNKDEKDPHKNDADFTGLGVGGAHSEPAQVRYVIDASPAQAAGFKRGDKIISVNGVPYTGYAVWYQSSGKSCSVQVNRNGKIVDLKITPVKKDFLQGYVDGTEKSARIIPLKGKKIGYVHLWSGGAGVTETLESMLGTKFRNTNGLILDLRDGYGGTSSDVLDMFFRPPIAFPDMISKDRKGKHIDRSYYDKPLAVLINKGVRSGKELNAFGLKRSRRGRLFGDTTAGYVVAGQYNPLNERAILYLAIVDLQVGGQRLEGKGVVPDVFVKDRLSPYDPVLQSALKYLAGGVAGK